MFLFQTKNPSYNLIESLKKSLQAVITFSSTVYSHPIYSYFLQLQHLKLLNT